MGRWGLVALALILAGEASAGDRPCRAVLKRAPRAPVAAYAVTSERLAWDRVEVAWRAGDGGLERTWAWSGQGGPAVQGVERLSCEGGVLRTHGLARSAGDVEEYLPPLPGLALPPRGGSTWAWTGVLTVGPAGEGLRTVADAAFEALPAEEVTVPAGTFTALPVRRELSVSGAVARTTTWVLPDEPWVVVREERVFLGPDGAEDHADVLELTALGD